MFQKYFNKFKAIKKHQKTQKGGSLNQNEGVKEKLSVNRDKINVDFSLKCPNYNFSKINNKNYSFAGTKNHEIYKENLLIFHNKVKQLLTQYNYANLTEMMNDLFQNKNLQKSFYCNEIMNFICIDSKCKDFILKEEASYGVWFRPCFPSEILDIQPDYYKEMICYNKRGRNPIFPSLIGEFGESYFKHGDPGVSNTIGAFLYQGEKENVVAWNPGPFGFESLYTDLTFSTNYEHNHYLTDMIKKGIDACKKEDINIISFCPGIYDNKIGGHRISSVFHLDKNGKIDEILFNNTNRYPLLESLHIFYLPILINLSATGLLHEKFSAKIKKYTNFVSNFFKNRNLNKMSFAVLNQMAKTPEFAKIFKTLPIQDVYIKTQGRSGNCLMSGDEVSFAMASVIAKNGWNSKVYKVREKRTTINFLRPNKAFNLQVRQLLPAYKNKIIKNSDRLSPFGTESDLSLIRRAGDIKNNHIIDAVSRRYQEYQQNQNGFMPDKEETRLIKKVAMHSGRTKRKPWKSRVILGKKNIWKLKKNKNLLKENLKDEYNSEFNVLKETGLSAVSKTISPKC